MSTQQRSALCKIAALDPASPMGCEFRPEKGNTLSDLGTVRPSVRPASAFPPLVCVPAALKGLDAARSLARALWRFRHSQGKEGRKAEERGKGRKVKAGGRQKNRTMCQSSHLPLPRSSFLRAKYWGTVTSEGGEFRSASLLSGRRRPSQELDRGIRLP